eukprot:m.64239 g.64239  ORF g.64239 m.64239 type:complete len:152 (-) comp11993_c0_seq2:692-1147(-)
MTTQYDIVGVTFSSLLTLCAEGKQRVGVLLGRRQQHDRFTIDDASETSRQAKEIVEVQGIYELGPSFVPLLTDIGTVAPSFDELIPTELHPVSHHAFVRHANLPMSSTLPCQLHGPLTRVQSRILLPLLTCLAANSWLVHVSIGVNKCPKY